MRMRTAVLGLAMLVGCKLPTRPQVTNGNVATVAVTPPSASLSVGDLVQFVATPEDRSGNSLSGRVVTWATSDAAVATVDGAGLVTGAGTGSATITAASEGRNGTAAIAVKRVAVATVAVTPVTAAVQVGQTVQLSATPKDARGNSLNGRVMTWATSNAAVETVNGSGLVSGVGPGAATVTAACEGQTGAAAITVTVVPVASVAVSPALASLTAGQTGQLTATRPMAFDSTRCRRTTQSRAIISGTT